MSTILVISGPAGVGKTTICDRLLNEFGSNITRVVTTTTRRPREGEKEGEDYFFTSVQEFHELLENEAFLENEIIHGNYYGTRKKSVFEKIDKKQDILINMDVKGAESFRKEIYKHKNFDGKMITIFLKPKSLEVLKKRLSMRATDTKSDIEIRLETAKQEITLADGFDYIIVSKDREHDYESVKKIFRKYLNLPGD
ncbi:MAG: guanylate kinase [Verrucomicrobiota bacterium]|nr:guanylate kinase [Verrucomicrobiota bacterium]